MQGDSSPSLGSVGLLKFIHDGIRPVKGPCSFKGRAWEKEPGKCMDPP